MKVALQDLGSLADDANKAQDDFRFAVWKATQMTGFQLLRALREDVQKSGIRRAPAMAKTWRQAMRPTNERDAGDLRIAAIVFNRSPVFSRYLARSGEIRAPDGGPLLIPIGRAAKLKLPIGQPRRKLLFFAGQAFGSLSFGRLKDGRAAIGVVTKSARGKERFEPLFLLRRSVTARARVQPNAIYARFAANAPERWFASLLAVFESRQTGAPLPPDESTELNADQRQGRQIAAASGIGGFSVGPPRQSGLSRGLGGGR